jgi:hypothetical protein
MVPYGQVVHATDAAPAFLREYMGCARREWENPSTLFDL